MKRLSILALIAVVGSANATLWDSGTGLGWSIPDSPGGPTTWFFTPTVGGGALTQFDIFMSPFHTWRSDLVISVTGNGGASVTLHNREDGSGDYISAFMSDTGVPIPASGALDSNSTGILYAPSIGTLAGVTASAGTWSLTAQDWAGADVGTIDRIRVTTVPEPASMAVLGLGAAALLRRRRKA